MKTEKEHIYVYLYFMFDIKGEGREGARQEGSRDGSQEGEWSGELDNHHDNSIFSLDIFISLPMPMIAQSQSVVEKIEMTNCQTRNFSFQRSAFSFLVNTESNLKSNLGFSNTTSSIKSP